MLNNNAADTLGSTWSQEFLFEVDRRNSPVYSSGDCQSSSKHVVSKSEVWEGLPVYPSLWEVKKKKWLGSVEMNFLVASYFFITLKNYASDMKACQFPLALKI